MSEDPGNSLGFKVFGWGLSFILACVVVGSCSGSSDKAAPKHAPVANTTIDDHAIDAFTALPASEQVKAGEAMVKRRKEREAYGRAVLAGKKAKEPNSESIKTTEWNLVKQRLNLVRPEAPEYQRAQALLLQMAADDKKTALEIAKSEERDSAGARQGFAERLDEGFVRQRMNVDVRASGPNNTILTIKWALASKVFAHDMSESGIINQAAKEGFKKVVITDGYSFNWRWDLTPKPKR